jgi:hypothetical protein
MTWMHLFGDSSNNIVASPPSAVVSTLTNFLAYLSLSSGVFLESSAGAGTVELLPVKKEGRVGVGATTPAA